MDVDSKKPMSQSLHGLSLLLSKNESSWNLPPIYTRVHDKLDLAEILSFFKQTHFGERLPVYFFLHDRNNLRYLLPENSPRLNQEIYFISLSEKTMNEVYAVNNILVNNDIGTFISRPGSPQKLEFKPNPPVQSFSGRRNNFHEKHLVIMTDQLLPYMALQPDYKTRAPYFESNQTFLVDEWIGRGLFSDVLEILATDLNFSYSLYTRKDGGWGSIVDGKPTGMLSNLHDGSADLILTAFAINSVRAQFANYLHPISIEYGAVFIRSQRTEDLSYKLFLNPIGKETWYLIVFVALVLGSWIYLANSGSVPWSENVRN